MTDIMNEWKILVNQAKRRAERNVSVCEDQALLAIDYGLGFLLERLHVTEDGQIVHAPRPPEYTLNNLKNLLDSAEPRDSRHLPRSRRSRAE